ncbi:hypothetical protein ACH41H_13365 [Streptomyces sp. NPDC020800]|uniref:hypothetical protein n=1 Tax=Streptomyces sp. NPDC020800 TaxID=3365092 RepID=UPI0037BA86C8
MSKPISVSMTVEDECVSLEVTGDGLSAQPWQLEVLGDARDTVTAPDMRIVAESESDNNETIRYLSPGRSKSHEAQAWLCWMGMKNPVVEKRGSVEDINLPAFYVDQHRTGISQEPDVQVSIRADWHPDSDLAVDAGTAPDARLSSAGDWVWKTSIGATETSPDGSVAEVQAHSVTGAARDHRREFLSGALLGVGAAAIIAALQEGLNRCRHDRPRDGGDRGGH